MRLKLDCGTEVVHDRVWISEIHRLKIACSRGNFTEKYGHVVSVELFIEADALPKVIEFLQKINSIEPFDESGEIP